MSAEFTGNSAGRDPGLEGVPKGQGYGGEGPGGGGHGMASSGHRGYNAPPRQEGELTVWSKRKREEAAGPGIQGDHGDRGTLLMLPEPPRGLPLLDRQEFCE